MSIHNVVGARIANINNTQEILKNWATAEYALNISSIITSAISIFIVVFCATLDRLILPRTSFRLAASIGLSCIIHSICRILTFHESIISHQSEASLRVLFWFTLASELCVVFLALIVCVHLFITVLLEKLQVARRIQMLYECIALSASLIVSHPVLYMYNSVRWDMDLHAVLFDGMPFLYRPTAWIVYLVWTLGTILFCAGVFVCIYFNISLSRNASQSVEKIHAPASTQRSHSWDEIILPRAKDKIQQEETRRITLRIALYAFLPVISELWPIVCSLAPRNSAWTYGLAIVMPSTQGLLCLALLVVTPAFDEPRAKFAAYTRRRIGKNESVSEMRLDFAKLNLSTINLSPYHSRDSSVYVATKQFER